MILSEQLTKATVWYNYWVQHVLMSYNRSNTIGQLEVTELSKNTAYIAGLNLILWDSNLGITKHCVYLVQIAWLWLHVQSAASLEWQVDQVLSFVTWVLWSSDCTALLKGLWFFFAFRDQVHSYTLE